MHRACSDHFENLHRVHFVFVPHSYILLSSYSSTEMEEEEEEEDTDYTWLFRPGMESTRGRLISPLSLAD